VPPRVLICSNYYPPTFVGGAELIAARQARALAALGTEVAVFAGDPTGRTRRHGRRRETHAGLPVYRVGLEHRDFDPDFVNFVHPEVEDHFDALLATYRPDVVHFHNLVGLSVALVGVARRRGVKTVLTVHDHWGFCHKNTLLKRGLEVCADYTRCAECRPLIGDGAARNVPIRMRRDFVRAQLEQLDAIVAPSGYLADAYARAGLPRERIHVVWYGIDVARFAAVQKTAGARVRFSFVGYLGAHKGVHVLLDALALLDDPTRVFVHFAGDGGERDACERRVRAIGLGDAVRFWGQVDNARIDAVYAETDVLVLPSVWPENQPVCLTEAMAARTAVIASRIGGIPELVEDGRSGRLFTPGNATELAACMTEFVHTPSRAIEYGEEGHRRMAVNTLEGQVAKLLALYGSLPSRATDDTDLRFVCAGERVDPECARAMNALARQGDRRWRFVLADWVDDDELARARALWVVDRSAGVADVLRGLRRGVPLLVPEDDTELRDLCVSVGCGLFYRDAAEAIRCLEHLVANEATRRTLGDNGRAFVARPWRASGAVENQKHEVH